jgi:hypothetical protein
LILYGHRSQALRLAFALWLGTASAAVAALPPDVARGLDQAVRDARGALQRDAARSGGFGDPELARILAERARGQAITALDAAVIQAIAENPASGEEIMARVRAAAPEFADTVTRDVAAVFPFLGRPVVAPPPPVAVPPSSPPAASPENVVSVPAPTVATASVLVNLIRTLVQDGMLTEAKGAELIRNAQDEVAIAQRSAPSPAAAAQAREGATTADAIPTPPGTPPSVRVPYVPEIVKRQIKEDVKQEVLATAKAENWAAPNAIPEWTKRFHFSGDFRLRSEWDVFDSRNSNNLLNFSALNAGNPFNLLDQLNTPLPTLDTTDDRQRWRVRARLGMTADITDELVAGLRLATGNTTNPVSTNNTLGTALNKEPFNLDRADLRYRPNSWATLWAGRFNNPWLSTDLVWSTQLMFDGLAAKVAPQLTDTIKPFFTIGAFPIENTPFSFPDNSADKQPSRDKWLYGAQAGVEWQPHRSYGVEFGVAYYDFSKIEGKLSSLCNANNSTNASFPCDTDNSRPGFQQQGNTLFAIRNNIPVAGVERQYFGLASPFRELNITTRLDYGGYDPIHLVLEGDFVSNLAFSGGSIAGRNPVNNRAPTSNNVVGPFDGGGNGFMARFSVGYPEINEFGDWNASVAYKYLASDAVVDAFTDSDFHLGGTNAKGYIFGVNFGLTHNVFAAAKWFSASEVSGPPYSVDVIQVDLNARF